jgi:AcrR family transcriptional regulator
MTIIERKEREKNELRELILLKAKELVDTKGHENLSIRKLAAAVEYSPGTIYLYFKDKDEIMHELMMMGFDLMTKSMVDAYKEADPGKRVIKIGHAYVKFGLENRDWYNLMFNSVQPMNHLEKCKEEWCEGIRLFDFLVSSCSEIIQNKSKLKVPPHILALQLWSSVHGLVSLIHSQRLHVLEGQDINELAYQTVELHYHLLFPEA